jgi:hypothetical protein
MLLVLPFHLIASIAEVVHGETHQVLQAILPAGQFLFCGESKAAVATKPIPLKDED